MGRNRLLRDLDAVATAIDAIDAGMPFEVDAVEDARVALQKARLSAQPKPSMLRRLTLGLAARVS